MKRSLVDSQVDRKNILNNKIAIKEIEKVYDMKGMLFEGIYYYANQDIADFFDIDLRTVERYIEENRDELISNGFKVIRGKELKEFREQVELQDFVTDNVVGHKVRNLSLSTFRTLLNFAMIINNNEKAAIVRQTILDIVIDVINKKTGGTTKYINQRDEEFLGSWFSSENYRKQFTDALRDYVEMGTPKYPIYTNKVYQCIFKEKASEYKKILNLKVKDNLRETMYAEVLDLISSFEYGIAERLKEESEKLSRKLTSKETNKIFEEFENLSLYKPLIDKARNKMASRDLAFREALHNQLQEYISPVSSEDYERFIGDKSKELSERLDEAKEVFERLQDR